MKSGQARTIALPIPDLAPGRYFVDLQVKYGGLILENGKFTKSWDETIEAHGECPIFCVSEPLGH